MSRMPQVLLLGLLVCLVLGCQRRQATAQGASSPPAGSRLDAVWAGTGLDKVTREELRAVEGQPVTNTVWDGERITLFGGRNEVLGFQLVLEAAGEEAADVAVEFSELAGPDGYSIRSRPADRHSLFDFADRPIELFYVRYLPIRGVSKLAYNHYDERHVPRRMRRPHAADGQARGGWEQRPDHDRSYPDIAVPLELHTPFEVAAGTSQAIWIDVYVPRTAPPGIYRGTVTVRERGQAHWQLPVELDVRSFTLPDLPTARTMVFISRENVNSRYLNEPYADDHPGSQLYRQSLVIQNRHFQLAHRHKISLIDGFQSIAAMEAAWAQRLDGTLFTPERGYDGPGIGVGNNVYSIGTYGSWPWRNGTRADMVAGADAWVAWFDKRRFKTPTDYFLFLLDESDDYDSMQTWSNWIATHTGPGNRLLTMATVPLPQAARQAPAISIPTSTVTVGQREIWEKAAADYRGRPDRRFFLYNGQRPASGTFVIEDDGVALRQLAWAQYKKRIDRWFVWESTYYNNYQGGTGETNVFRQAHTFGGRDGRDPSLGETGWNYNNGDGVLFYPGTDRKFPQDSYGIDGPIASLRLKYWRRGLQDVDYLALAAQANPQAVRKIVERIVPRVLWEYDVDDPADPTWVRTDISWSTNPDDWESARRELADLIESARDAVR